MKQQFVTYEIALKLKELGFNEPCLGFYEFGSIDEEWHLRTKYISKNEYDDCNYILRAPLWQQVIDWFREKYLIDIDNGWCILNPFGKKQEGYNISVYDRTRDEFVVRDFHIDYYKAREQAILKAIELCQNKK